MFGVRLGVEKIFRRLELVLVFGGEMLLLRIEPLTDWPEDLI